MTRVPTLQKRLQAVVDEMVRRGILLEEARDQLERHFLSRVLNDCGGNQSKAAEVLRLHRNTLRRKLLEHDLL